MSDILVNADATIAYSIAHSATIAFVDQPSPTSPVHKQSGGDAQLSAWGDNNDHPQWVYKKAKESTIIPPVLEWKWKAAYGKGLIYGKMVETPEGVVFKREYRPEIEQWLKRSNAKRYAMEMLMAIYWYQNGFAEIVRSKDGKTIVAIAAQDSCWCRLGKPNEKTGLIEECFINANWAEGAKPEDKATAMLSVIDPYFDSAEALREVDFKEANFIYPISLPSPERTLYQDAAWQVILTSKWLEVAKAIPEFKKKLIDQQLTIKYHIEINRSFWDWKFPDWSKKTLEERAKILVDQKEEFDKMMAGVEGAGKSLFTIMNFDNNGKEQFGWKITPIDTKIIDGTYVEDSQEASSHIYTALGVDPTLIGISPGKTMGAGSGSDKRVAFNNYISTQRPILDLVLEPLDLISQYNGWGEDLVWDFENTLVMTLDSGSQTASSTKAQQETK